MEMRKPQRWFSVAAAVGVAAVVVAPVAGAHTALIASEPAAGAVLSAAPASVSATFDEAPEAAFAALTLSGPGGVPVSTGATVVSGSQLTVAVPSTVPAGTHTASYRLMAADGHVVTGSWSFTVAPPG